MKKRRTIQKGLTISLASALMMGSISTLPISAQEMVTITEESKVNLALGKVAFASNSETDEFGPENLVDGVKDRGTKKTRWGSLYNESNPWVSIDLGEVTTFNQLVIEWERRNVQSYEILVSNDNVEWVSVKTLIQPQVVSDVILFDEVEARYVKVQIHDYTAEGFAGETAWKTVSMYELEVYQIDAEPETPPEEPPVVIPMGSNVALNKPARASSIEVSQFGPENAVDGSIARGSRWASGFGATGHWLEIDLESTQDIYNVVIEWERRSATKYRLQVSDDQQNWRDVATRTQPATTKDHITLETPANGRYIRVYVDECTNAVVDGVAWQTVSIFEMEVYNGEIPPEPEQPVPPIEIANALELKPVTAGMMTYELPEVPEGYEIAFIGANYEEIIDHNLQIYTPLVDTKVKLNFEVIDQREGVSQGERAISKEYEIIVPGRYQTMGNAKPKVMPELSEWVGKEGNFTTAKTSKIVISDASLSLMAETFAQDYYDLFKVKLNVEVGSQPNAHDFYFELNNKRPELREEGYLMDISDSVNVEANSAQALFLSTRTILQILKQNGNYIPQGVTRDYPEYDIRGLILDVGRKFISLEGLNDIMKTMSWYKMNDFQVHLNDNYIFLEEYGEQAIEKAYAGFRLESDYENNGVRLTSADGFYTKEEFGNFLDESKVYGVNVTPEIDSPAHALAFIKVHPEYAWGTNGRMAEQLDVRKPEVVEYVQTVFNEYLQGTNPVFRDAVVHIGADEFKGTKEEYRKYVDTMLRFVQEQGRTVRLWGSLTEKDGVTPIISEGVQMNVWNNGYSDPSDMYDLGYDIINSEDGKIYIVPDAGYYGDYLNTNWIYNNYNANEFGNGDILPAGSPQMKGGMFGVWNDMVDNRANGIVTMDIYDRILPAIQALSERLWGDAEDKSYAEFEELASILGTAPNSNPYFKVDSIGENVVKYDFTRRQGLDVSGNNYHIEEQVNVNLGKEVEFLGGSSYMISPIRAIGPNYEISFTITRNEEGSDEEQILFESADGAFKAVQKDTQKVGFSREGYDYSFDYTLPKGEEVELRIVGKMVETSLYVNGVLVDTIAKGKTENKRATFIFPLEVIGSKTKAFEGTMKNLKVTSPKEYVPNEDLKLDSSLFSVSSPAGQDQAGDGIDKAFDNDPTTIWHSNWSTPNTFPMSATINFNDVHTIDTFEYLPRQSGTNGYIKRYELHASTDGVNFTKFHEGSFTEDKKLKTVRFEAMEASAIKLVVLDGVGGFSSAAEFNFYTASVHFNALENLLFEIATLDAQDYTTSSWQALVEAKAIAEAMLGKEGATQVEVDEAYLQLQHAYDALEVKEEVETPSLDASALESVLESVLMLDASLYTEASWSALQNAIAQAQAALEDATTQAELDAALAHLNAAKEQLEVKPEVPSVDPSALESLLDSTLELEESDYTETSWAALQTAIAQAQAALENATTQAEVDEALANLTNAIDQLEVKEEVETPTLDSSVLEAVLGSTLELEESLYTEYSWSVLQTAIKKANQALANATTQAELDDALAILEFAIERLEETIDQPKPEEIVDGWNEQDGVWYYYEDGEMTTGWLKLGNIWYYLDDTTGVMATGWKYINQTWYYFLGNGHMAKGWQEVGGTWYYLQDTGAMATGWLKLGNVWYHLQDSGAMSTGWQYINNTWYYLLANGHMATGWQEIGGTWYYLHHNGAMASGWLTLGNITYYLQTSGAMVTGWQFINNTWYYFYANGHMATSGVIDGWQISPSGAAYPKR